MQSPLAPEAKHLSGSLDQVTCRPGPQRLYGPRPLTSPPGRNVLIWGQDNENYQQGFAKVPSAVGLHLGALRAPSALCHLSSPQQSEGANLHNVPMVTHPELGVPVYH